MNHRYSVARLAHTPMLTPLPPTLNVDSRSAADMLHVVWLRQDETSCPQALPIINAFYKAGIYVWIMTAKEVSLEQILFFDLIILEAWGPKGLGISNMITHIRHGSHAPLLLLSDSNDMSWRIRAFREGADAVLPVSTPPAVFLARCQALLRRWRSNP